MFRAIPRRPGIVWPYDMRKGWGRDQVHTGRRDWSFYVRSIFRVHIEDGSCCSFRVPRTPSRHRLLRCMKRSFFFAKDQACADPVWSILGRQRHSFEGDVSVSDEPTLRPFFFLFFSETLHKKQTSGDSHHVTFLLVASVSEQIKVERKKTVVRQDQKKNNRRRTEDKERTKPEPAPASIWSRRFNDGRRNEQGSTRQVRQVRGRQKKGKSAIKKGK